MHRFGCAVTTVENVLKADIHKETSPVFNCMLQPYMLQPSP